MVDINRIPTSKRDLYFGGRHSRSEGRSTAPSELNGTDLKWWMEGWSERDNELCPERVVTHEQAALIRKERERSERRTAKEKTQVRRKIGAFQDKFELKKLTAEVWED